MVTWRTASGCVTLRAQDWSRVRAVMGNKIDEITTFTLLSGFYAQNTLHVLVCKFL